MFTLLRQSKRIFLGFSLLLILLQSSVLLNSDEILDVYQARAELLYEAGVDEDALIDRSWNASEQLRPGMLAPNFSVMELDGKMQALDDLKGEQFVLFVIGNAT